MKKDLVLDVEENPNKIGHWFLFALQHILAMFVACITVPIITHLPIAPTIVAAGIGTLLYILVTKKQSPVFLSSSFAYLAPMISALALGSAVNENFLAVMIGMVIVGIVYVLVALIIKLCGTKWLDTLLPPVVIGPVIMVIGLSLAVSAIGNLTLNGGDTYNIYAVISGLIAMLVTALAAHYGKRTIKLIPFVIGMLAGYFAASIFTIFGNAYGNVEMQLIDFSIISNNFNPVTFKSFLAIPDFMFLKNMSAFKWSQIPEILLLFVPVAFVTICEHIGDHKNLSNIIGRDLLKKPGLTRTLIGDGVATAISGCVCGAANTTYGENVAVIGVSKIASVNVIILASIMTIGIGFIRPLMTIIETIPSCVTGGVSLILYGFIASSGVKMLIQEKIDFGNTKNIFIASVILVTGIGGLCINIGPICITSIAVSMLLGILLNSILINKKDKNIKDMYTEETV